VPHPVKTRFVTGAALVGAGALVVSPVVPEPQPAHATLPAAAVALAASSAWPDSHDEAWPDQEQIAEIVELLRELSTLPSTWQPAFEQIDFRDHLHQLLQPYESQPMLVPRQILDIYAELLSEQGLAESEIDERVAALADTLRKAMGDAPTPTEIGPLDPADNPEAPVPPLPDWPEVPPTEPPVSPVATTMPDPLAYYGEVLQRTLENLRALWAVVEENPAPILARILRNQSANLENLVAAVELAGDRLIRLVTDTVPDRFQAAIRNLVDGNIETALNALVEIPMELVAPATLLVESVTLWVLRSGGDLISALGVIAAAGRNGGSWALVDPLVSTIGAVGRAIQDVADAVRAGDPVGLAYALINAPATVLDGLLNGNYGPTRVGGPAGLLTPYQGPIGFALDLRRRIADSMALQPVRIQAIDPTLVARAPESTVDGAAAGLVTLTTTPPDGPATPGTGADHDDTADDRRADAGLSAVAAELGADADRDGDEAATTANSGANSGPANRTAGRPPARGDLGERLRPVHDRIDRAPAKERMRPATDAGARNPGQRDGGTGSRDAAH